MKRILKNNAVSLSIEIRLSPANQREFLQVVLQMVKEGRLSQSNISYHLKRDMEKNDHFEVYSEWKDRASLEDYIRTQNFGSLLGALNILSYNFDIKVQNMSIQREGKSFVKQVRNH